MDIPDWLSLFPFPDWSGRALSCWMKQCKDGSLNEPYIQPGILVQWTSRFPIVYASLIWLGISRATPWKWNSLVHSTLFLSECIFEPEKQRGCNREAPVCSSRMTWNLIQFISHREPSQRILSDLVREDRQGVVTNTNHRNPLFQDICGYVWPLYLGGFRGGNFINFIVHEKNYSPDSMAGEDEGKSGYFQCAVHLPVDKWN